MADLTLGTLPSAVVWPPLMPPANAAASRLRGLVAGVTDGHFYVADRGAAVVWSLTIAPKVHCGSSMALLEATAEYLRSRGIPRWARPGACWRSTRRRSRPWRST